MDIGLLKQYIEEGKSTWDISKTTGKSQTSVRYWLRKYGLNTKYRPFSDKEFYDTPNEHKCVSCGSTLTGYTTKYCNDCRNKENLKITYDYQRKRSNERKKVLIEKAGGGCCRCGYSKNMAALCFHHKDPENKTYNLDSRKLSNTRWDSILEEFKKCELLCHNCHMETHHPELDL